MTMVRRGKPGSRMHLPVCAVIISALVTFLPKSVSIGSEGASKNVDWKAEIRQVFGPSGSRAGSIPGDCAWRSAPLAAALKSWLEYDAPSSAWNGTIRGSTPIDL